MPPLEEVQMEADALTLSTVEHAAWVLGIAAMLKMGKQKEYEGCALEDIAMEVTDCSRKVIDECRKDIESTCESIGKKIKEIT